jgi:hypothetical protein
MVREVGGHSSGASGDMRSGTPLLKAMPTAAAADPNAAKLWEEHRQQRRIGVDGFAATLAANASSFHDRPRTDSERRRVTPCGVSRTSWSGSAAAHRQDRPL